MIPTMIVAGLVVGPVWRERRSRPDGLLVAAALALTWGALVIAIDGWSFGRFVASTGLGAANLLVGALAAITLTLGLRAVRRLAVGT